MNVTSQARGPAAVVGHDRVHQGGEGRAAADIAEYGDGADADDDGPRVHDEGAKRLCKG